MFAVRCAYREENAWFFPCGEREAVIAFLGELLSGTSGVCLLYLREEDVSLLKEHFPGRFRIEPANDASEYLYDRTEYAEMPGKKYKNIRNDINHLIKQHDIRTEPLTAGNLETARKMLAGWAPRSESEYFSRDHETARLMLDYFDRLGMTGVIVCADGEAVAVASGFPLSENAYDIAFSKSLELEKGLQYYIRRALVSFLPGQYTVLNGEEDLGLPGLRIMKTLENPIGRIEMYSAYEA
jgi:hypothetical protein